MENQLPTARCRTYILRDALKADVTRLQGAHGFDEVLEGAT